MFFFRIRKDPFYRFLSLLIYVFHSSHMSIIFYLLNVWFPYMSCHYLREILTLCASISNWAVFTNTCITFIFPITLTICCAVSQYLILRTNIAIVIFIIHIFIFLKKAFFCHWACIWHYRYFLIAYDCFCDCRCFISCIHYYIFCIFILSDSLIQWKKGYAIMYIPGSYLKIQYKAVSVTASIRCIGKYLFVLSFMKVSALWVCCTYFLMDFFRLFVLFF